MYGRIKFQQHQKTNQYENKEYYSKNSICKIRNRAYSRRNYLSTYKLILLKPNYYDHTRRICRWHRFVMALKNNVVQTIKSQL